MCSHKVNWLIKSDFIFKDREVSEECSFCFNKILGLSYHCQVDEKECLYPTVCSDCIEKHNKTVLIYGKTSEHHT